MGSVKGKKQKKPKAGRGWWRGAGKVAAWVAVWTGRLLVVAAIAAVALLAWLHLVGVPRYVLDGVLAELEEMGYVVETDGVKLEIDRGATARGVRVYADKDAPEPFLTAESLSAAVDVPLLLRRRVASPLLELQGGRLHLPVGKEGGRAVEAEGIGLRFTMRGEEMVVRGFEAEAMGVKFKGRGAVYGLGEGGGGMEGNLVAMLMEALAAAPESALQAMDWWGRVHFAEPPEVEFTFSLYPDHPDANAAAVHVSAGAGRVLRVEFTGASASAQWRDGKVRVGDWTVEADGGRASGSAEWDPATGMAEIKARNSLKASTAYGALPPPWRKQMEAWLGTEAGAMEFPVFASVEAGPAPAEELLGKAKGRVGCGGFSLKGTEIAHVSAEFECDGDVVRVGRARLETGGETASEIEATDAVLDTSTWAWSTKLAGKVRPDMAMAFLPEDGVLLNVLERFGFTEQVEVRGAAKGTADGAWEVRGPVKGRNFTLHGVEVGSAKALVRLNGSGLEIRDFEIQRPEGEARGSVTLDWDRQTVEFKGDSSLAARAVIGFMGPFVEEFFEGFQLDGPCRAKAEGTFDYGTLALNDIRGHVYGEEMGWGRWLADWLEADLEVTGKRLSLTGVEAGVYGGKAEGAAEIYPVRGAGWWYEAEGTAKNVQLAQALAASLDGGAGKLRGEVALSGRCVGSFGAGGSKNAAGAGRISIANGMLFETGLFAGLTAILQKVLPGFNLFAQTDASMDFTIGGGKVRTENAKVEGALFSVSGEGEYRFDNQLDFEVELQLLRGGLLARLVRLATLPVTHLLKIHVTGTPAHAKWSPENLNPAKLIKLGLSVIPGTEGETEAEEE